MKKLQLFQLLFPFIILKLSEEMDTTDEQNSTFPNFAVSQGASTHTQGLIDENSNNFWKTFLNIIDTNEHPQNPKIQTPEEFSKNKNLPLPINQGVGNFHHNSILSDNVANAEFLKSVPHLSNEQFLDTTPQNIASSSIHDTYLQNTGMFID